MNITGNPQDWFTPRQITWPGALVAALAVVALILASLAGSKLYAESNQTRNQANISLLTVATQPSPTPEASPSPESTPAVKSQSLTVTSKAGKTTVVVTPVKVTSKKTSVVKKSSASPTPTPTPTTPDPAKLAACAKKFHDEAQKLLQQKQAELKARQETFVKLAKEQQEKIQVASAKCHREGGSTCYSIAKIAAFPHNKLPKITPVSQQFIQLQQDIAKNCPPKS